MRQYTKTEKFFHITKGLTEGYQTSKISISLATSVVLQIANENLKCQKESSFNHKKVVSTAIDVISFMAKVNSFSAERRDRLKPALNEEIRSFCELKLTSTEYPFEKNMDESLKLAKEN